jgi:ferredoxin
MERKFTVERELPEGEVRQLQVAEDEFILSAAYRAGLDLPSMCLQGWCLTCAARALPRAGATTPGAWDQSDSRRYYEKDRQAGYLLPCTAQPRSDLKLQTHQRIAMRDHRLAQGLAAPRG